MRRSAGLREVAWLRRRFYFTPWTHFGPHSPQEEHFLWSAATSACIGSIEIVKTRIRRHMIPTLNGVRQVEDIAAYQIASI